MIRFFKGLITKAWLQHLVFWVLSLYAIGSYFSISSFLKFIDFIYAGFFHIPLMLLVYVNLRYHIPKFLQREKYLLYTVLSVFNIATAYFLHELVFEVVIPVLPTDFYMVSFTDAYVLITIFIIYLVVTTLLKLSKSWYTLQRLEKEKLSLELNSLKMQINPHFLFNSLNSVYSLARKKSNETPEVILRLSDLLRYMIYEVTDENVSLRKEVDAIQNYLDIQKLRLEEESEIQFDVDLDDANRSIAPLLFFPLIENSFKHGLKGNAGENFVRIKLKCVKTKLSFVIENNKGREDKIETDGYGGIGLENVEKRLKLIYGSNATMSVVDAEDSFEVNINLTFHD